MKIGKTNLMLSKLKSLIRKFQAQQVINKLHYPFDKDWFKGKRVVVIGGADSVLKEKLGEYIDGFDVVVRINKGVEVLEKQKEYVGTKTDILFHSFMDNPKEPGSSPITAELWKKYNVGRLIYALNWQEESRGMYDVLLFAKKSKGIMEFTDIPQELYRKNIKALHPFKPTTGITAIQTIMECGPKELYITGITFFKTPHNLDYRNKTLDTIKNRYEGIHNPDVEYEVAKKLWEKHPDIIKPDKVLEEIFKTN